MKVRHANLINVFGRPAKHFGLTFVPADLRLEGSRFSPSFPLAKSVGEPPPVLLAAIAGEYDAAWVRARIPTAFGFTPAPSEREKTPLSEYFVALEDGKDEAFAFECADVYGRTSLWFSHHETEGEGKTRVAEAFWGLLLSEPDELTDFETSVMHLGACITLHFGCEDGEPYCYETAD